MKSLPTLPRRTWLERSSLGLACALLATGGLTLLSWWLRVDEVLQPFGNAPAMRANTALSFALLGTVLLAIEFHRTRVLPLAFVPALLGSITLLQYALGRNLGVDELVASDHLFVASEFPGRPSPMLAICGLLSGLLLGWRMSARGAAARLFSEAVVGSMLTAAGFSTLLGYVASLPAVYHWGSNTATSPIAGLGVMVLGLAVLLLAWRDSLKQAGEPPAWSPLPFVGAGITLTVILAVGLHDRESAFIRGKTQTQVDALAYEIDVQLHQSNPQTMLHVGDLSRQRRLADMHRFRSAAEVFLGRKRTEIPHLPQGETHREILS